MKSSKKRSRLGALLFFIPILLVVVVIAYAVVSGTASPYGTLVVRAQSSGRYYTVVGLNVTADVGAQSGVTPFSLSLTQGTYTVTYGSLPWYLTPPARVIDVVAGRISYVVGVYDPVVKAISIVGNGFNETKLSAEHGVTPVVWVNEMNAYAVLYSTLTGIVRIPPSQNYTYVFSTPGTYVFSLQATNSPDLTIAVR